MRATRGGRASGLLERLPVPTWRLAAAAAAGALVVLAVPGAPLVAVVATDALLAVAALVDWLGTPAPARLRVERELPAVVALGAAGRVRWRVWNPTGRVLRVRLSDELAPSLRADTRRARLVVPAGGRASAATGIRPRRRGRFEPVELAMRVEGPLGLVARQATRPLPGVLRVYPPFGSRREAELRIRRGRLAEVGLRSAQGRGGGTEFDALREYTPDDEFRRIDWAATARARRPIVRSYRAERNQTVLLLLDTGRTMAGRVGGLPRLDHALDAAMMLTAVSSRLGDRAGLVAFADRVRGVVAPGHARDQLGRVTEVLYRLSPELVESDYRGAFAQTLVRFRRRSLLVVLTELAEHAVDQTLLPALPVVARDHVVLVAGVRDPDVQRWADSMPVDPGAAYRKAAAVAALAGRRRTVAGLRGAGATVVDAPPGRLGPRLADAYLHVKATGRL